MKGEIAIVAAILAVAGNIPYIIEILRGKVRPHPYTWFVWSIVSLVIFFGQLQKGAGVGVIPTAAAEIFTIIIFFLSLRHGWKGVRPIDTAFLAAALIGLIPWLLTKDPTLSVVTVVVIDVIAFLPTLRKTWVAPQSESPVLYIMNVMRHALALFSLEAYNVATTLHSIAMITTNTFMTLIFILRGKLTRSLW